MARKNKKKEMLRKVVSEVYPVKEKKGGGIIKMEAWEDSDGKLVKYSLAYINHLIYPDDNGRVLGYDNSHDYHHRHYSGEVTPVEDFTDFQDIVERFEKEIKEFIK